MENEFVRRFAEMSDDELQKYAVRAQLDENARVLLTAELSRRGLLLPEASHVPSTGSAGDANSMGYRQVIRGLSPLNAQILLGRLQAEGVDAYLSGANVTQINPLWFYALGGVRLFVHREHLAIAFDVIDATWKGDYEVGVAEEQDAPGRDRIESKRQAGWMCVLSVAMVMGGISLAALWWPSYASPSYSMTSGSPSDLLARGMASTFLVTYAGFWLLFVECAVRRQKRP
ncbi:hypothetical protein [Dyella choica]|uniref:DUF2007 domain-containing protein n=1 Tax=Dyella choica TaxID=1927959 RepID=A0A3S0S8T0_9GAMM|nr:hypothetical protein [Dyella choica]RUL73158.1 hypothetical protein EKH80_16020 [Dyella choica]